MGAGSRAGQLAYMHLSQGLSGRNAFCSLQGTDLTVGLAKCHVTYTRSRDKTALDVPEIEKDIRTQYGTPSTGCLGSLSVGQKMLQAQGSFLCS